MLLQAFRKEATIAIELDRKKREDRERAEKKRLEAIKKKKEEEEMQNSAAITELTDAEAEALQKELNEKYVCFGYPVAMGIVAS